MKIVEQDISRVGPTEEGTGVVHIAPAYGTDDMNLGKEKNLPFILDVGLRVERTQ